MRINRLPIFVVFLYYHLDICFSSCQAYKILMGASIAMPIVFCNV